ncbi:MAG: hypothetical protein ABW005_01315 [Burkholderiaceae bacterium]
MASIVVIDEDGPIRALLAEWLIAAGYKVKALSPLDSCGGLSADLVLLDLPRLRQQGREHVRRVQAAFLGAVMIGLSTQLAANLPAYSALVQDMGLRGLLAKPASRDELLAAVAQALETGR